MKKFYSRHRVYDETMKLFIEQAMLNSRALAFGVVAMTRVEITSQDGSKTEV